MGTQLLSEKSDGGPPLISVIIPAFNEEKNIRQLLLGLAHQVQPSGSFEVLLVNNGSTDGTLNVVRGLKFPKLQTSYYR